jgi:steroid delta-isomerase-like uncharacterized protein
VEGVTVAEQDSAAIGREWFESWNERDFDRGAALFSEDAEIIETPTDERFRGPDGFRQESEKWASALPDGRIEIREVIASPDAAVLENTVRGTHDGPFATPEGEIPPTGRRVELDFCTIVGVENGKIARGRHYFDAATMMQQLGLMEEPAGAAG